MNWVIRLGTDLRPVGVVQATVAADRSAADVAWEVGVAFQGHGFASEAARAVVDRLISSGVAEVRACIHPAHAASATVASRAGLDPSDERIDGEVVWIRRAT